MKNLIVLGSLAASSSLASAQYGIDYNFYYRTGIAYSQANVEGVCFNQPGWPDMVPRLGNECGNYLEMMLSKTYKPKGDDPKAAWFKGTVTFSMVSDGNQSKETVQPETQGSGGPSGTYDFEWGNREIFVESGNILSEGSKVWVGKRFYRRLAVPMWDFFFLQHNGLGFGLEDQSLGIGKLSTAWLRNSSGASDAQPFHNALDLRYAIPLPTSQLELILIGGEQGKQNPRTGEEAWEKISGQSLTLFWEGKERPYQFKLAAQYGQGLYGSRPDGYLGGWNTGSTLNRFDETAFLSSDPLQVDKAKAWQKSSGYRLLANWLWAPDAPFWIDMAAFYGRAAFGGRKDPLGENLPDRETMALGMRPAYLFTDHHSVEADFYYSVMKDGPAYDGFIEPSKYEGKPVDRELGKITLAYVLRPLPFEWAKPVFRAYGTVAKWNGKTEGDKSITSYLRPIYADKTTGYTLGVMAEVWL